jgi:hypothetical protein
MAAPYFEWDISDMKFGHHMTWYNDSKSPDAELLDYIRKYKYNIIFEVATLNIDKLKTDVVSEKISTINGIFATFPEIKDNIMEIASRLCRIRIILSILRRKGSESKAPRIVLNTYEHLKIKIPKLDLYIKVLDQFALAYSINRKETKYPLLIGEITKNIGLILWCSP